MTLLAFATRFSELPASWTVARTKLEPVATAVSEIVELYLAALVESWVAMT
jgi:hypothetical protein